MPDEQPHTRLRYSLLDRLIGDQTTDSLATPTPTAVRQVVQWVRRDLQNLLNTRLHSFVWPEEYTQLDSSIVNYGLPSFSRVENARDYDAVAELIRVTIERFEPRLQAARVEPLGEEDANSRVLRFRIKAQLVVEPLDDSIAFTSTLDPVSGNFRVERSNA